MTRRYTCHSAFHVLVLATRVVAQARRALVVGEICGTRRSDNCFTREECEGAVDDQVPLLSSIDQTGGLVHQKLMIVKEVSR